jgi:hypothetical protein
VHKVQIETWTAPEALKHVDYVHAEHCIAVYCFLLLPSVGLVSPSPIATRCLPLAEQLNSPFREVAVLDDVLGFNCALFNGHLIT